MVHGSSPTHKTRARALRGLETDTVRPARRPLTRSNSLIWMRLAPALFVLAAIGVAVPRPASAERTLVVAPVVGLRSFDDDLDLDSEASIGFRFGMRTSERVSVLVDYVHSVPARETTGQLAYITGLRSLAQVRLLTGTMRPYLIAGVGGVLFNFSDANDTAGGAITLGGGLEVKPWSRTAVFAEGSVDLYRSREVIYSTTGEELSVGPRRTQRTVGIAAGVSVEF